MGNDPVRRDTASADTKIPDALTTEHGARDEAPSVENRPIALIKEFYRRFMEDDVLTLSGALAFTGVLSLLPLALFAILALGMVFRDPMVASQQVEHFTERLLPGAMATRAARELLQQTQLVQTAQDMSSHIGFPLLIGVGSLLWAGITLFATAANVMNRAWDVSETRNPIKIWGISLGVLLGAGAIFLLSLAITGLPAFLDRGFLGTAGHGLALLAGILSPIVAIILDTAMFVLIYKVLPNTRVSWRSALFAGVVTGLLWEIFKQGFAFYLTHFGNSGNKIYGALGGAVLLVTWIYYSSVVLLSGAEIGKMYQEHREEGGVAQRGAD